MDWVFEIQRSINEAVNHLIGSFAETRDWSALLIVLPLGIVFGAVHAITPGHSKIVLASYLVGSRLAFTRSAMVAGALALTHIASAVVLALLAAPLITRTIGAAGRAPAIEVFSRGALALIGIWLIVRAVRHRPHIHREGVMVGVVAGLVPCPLTLFAMFLALSKGVVVAGLTFPAAMMIGAALTLTGVATVTVLARDRTLALNDKPIVQIQHLDHESRVHIDIESDDIPAEVARLEKLGATGALGGDAGAHWPTVLRSACTTSRISEECQFLGLGPQPRRHVVRFWRSAKAGLVRDPHANHNILLRLSRW
jgi:nickel/cobalt exporter